MTPLDVREWGFLIKNKTNMKIKSLPKGLQKLANTYIKEQKFENNFDNESFVSDIVWRNTREGNLFWRYVHEGAFNEARKIYDWDFLSEDVPGKDGQTFKVVLDEDWFKNTTWENWDWKSDVCMLEWETLAKRLNDISKQEYEKLSQEEKENINKKFDNMNVDFSKNIKPEKIKGWVESVELFQELNEDDNNLEETTWTDNSLMIEEIEKLGILPIKTNYWEEEVKSVNQGQKNNQDKLPMSVVKKQFPKALEAVVKCSQYGHLKYKETDKDYLNYKHVEGGSQTYRDAAERHSYFPVGSKDEESGLPHIFHEVWNKLAELELFLEENLVEHK